jgi:hypothetical protein
MKPLASLILALLAGCSVVGPNDFAGAAGANRTSPWYETGQTLKPRDEIEKTVKDLIVRCNYQAPDIDRNGYVMTDWDVRLSPRWREGFRSRLEVEIVPLDRGFNVRTRSWMEVNNNSVAPSDPNKVEWVGAGVTDRHADRINEAALRFHNMLKFRLFGLND